MGEERALRRPLHFERLRAEEPDLVALLESTDSLEQSRDRLTSYLDDLEFGTRIGAFDVDRIERSCTLGWIATLKEMLSPENEAIVGFSTLDLLRRAVLGERDAVSANFVDEFVHIARAIRGRSESGRGWLGSRGVDSEFEEFPISGRRGAVMRSAVLDEMAETLRERVDQAPCGLDGSLIEARTENRDRILRHFRASVKDWESPAWHATHILKGAAGLRALRELAALSGEELASLSLAVRYRIPWGITPYYLSLFDLGSTDRVFDGQVRSQVIPSLHTVRAMIEHRADRRRVFDFMRERDTSPIDRVTRRYPAVAILKVCDTCPQICTYCQRNWAIGEAMDPASIPSRRELDLALDWFEEHSGISDVLLTGGDPLVHDDRTLGYLIDRFRRMDHVMHLRIGTRVLVTMPMRVTERLARRLGEAVEPGRRSVAVVTHVESAAEVTPELAAATSRLLRRGIHVYNQQVLTLEASRRFRPVATRIALKRAGIDPYYTFYPKGKDEHRDVLVPIARIVQELREEARLLPGTFRTDEPVFNVPGLGKCHLRAEQDRELIAIRNDGRRVYLFHPWEKGIAPVAPWPYVDVSIADYLRRVASLGDRAEDYESIWYYL